jgi:hypothetical protein
MQALTAPLVMTAAPAGWLRSRGFDAWFIAGTAALGISAGCAAVIEPELAWPLILADLWLLGYHHVIATFTRVCFDRHSLRAHLGLVTWLPLAILAVVVALVAATGLWILTSIYLYWQWWHYTRQSWGVAQVYRRKAGDGAAGPERLYQAAFYLLPLWGILHRSEQAPERFLGVRLAVLPVAEPVVIAVGALSILTLAAFAATRVVAWWRGELPLAHTLYLASHVVMFAIGYLWIPNITAGWLAVNVWHNTQYLLFVWHFNNKRYGAGVDAAAPLLSTVSQRRNIALYALGGFALAVAVYSGIHRLAPSFAALVVLTHTINFHHYVVDAVIWKVRRRPLQETLGLAATPG